VALPRGVQLVRAIPAQVRFDFERSARRAIPVTVRFAGALAAGWRVTGFETVPRELSIAGPASSVAAVEVLETDPVNLSGVTGDVEQPAAVFVSEAGVRFISSPRVMVKVRVQKGGN
jgi:YbbR domain-containing protein